MSSHLVIVSYNWPPRNAIGTHRPYAWAKVWSSRGLRVTVLTAQKYTLDEPLDLVLPSLPGVEVIVVNWSNEFSGVASYLLKVGQLRTLARWLRAAISRYFPMPIEPRQGWLTAALPIARKLSVDADIVISTYGPAMSHQLGAAMKLVNPMLFWVADYRDIWSQSQGGDLTELQRRNIQDRERITVCENADMLTGVSDDIVRQLSELTGKKAVLAPNGFDMDEQVVVARLLRPKKNRIKPFRIVHTGTLYKGTRNPEPLLRALADLVLDGLISYGDVFVDFYGSRIDVARMFVTHPEYRHFVNLIGHVPHDQALKAQQNADLLLLLESEEKIARGVLTGKIFEYIASGVPIISLGSLRSFEIPKFLKKTRTGVSFENQEIDNLKEFLIQLLLGGNISNYYEPNIDVILKYSRLRLAGEFFDEINKSRKPVL